MTVTAQLSAAWAFEVSVPFMVTGTAASPADYTITANPITIAAGGITGATTIIVVNDSIQEPDETVVLTMGALTNAIPGAITVHTATIQDDESTPSVEFTAASQTGTEAVGSMTVTVQLSAASAFEVQSLSPLPVLRRARLTTALPRVPSRSLPGRPPAQPRLRWSTTRWMSRMRR